MSVTEAASGVVDESVESMELSAAARTVRHAERNTEMNLSELLVTTNITIERNAQRGLVTVRPTDPSDPQWPAHVASFTLADEEAAGLWHVMSGDRA